MNREFIKNAYSNEDYELLIDYFLQCDVLDDFEKTYLGLMLFDIGFSDEAINFLTQINEHDVALKDIIGKVYIELALYNYSKAQYYESLQMFVKSKAFDFKDRYKADQWIMLLNLNLEANGWVRYKSKNFNFNFQSEIDSHEIESFKRKYEISYKRIEKFFQIELPKKIDVFVYSSRIDIIGNSLSYSNSFLTTIHTNLNDEDGHEIAHIFIDSLRDNGCKNNFFAEGIAEVFNNTEYNDCQKYYYQVNHVYDISQKFDELDSKFTYKIGKIFFSKLLIAGGKCRFIEICKNQTWENLTKLYGRDLIDQISIDCLREYYREE